MTGWLLRLAGWLRGLAALCRRTSGVVGRLTGGTLMCEACKANPAVPEMGAWSEVEQRQVAFCRWCGKRFLRVNEAMATGIKTRRRKGGGRAH